MKLATSIGAVNISMGQTQEEAAAAAQTMITIAADVAAFNGEIANSDQVLEDMNSALVGNYETLDKYGINLTAAMVEQKALEMTAKSAKNELTELEKRTAALTLIQEQSELQQGSLSEAQERGATTTAEATAKMKDAQTAVGEALLPVKRLAAEGFLALADILTALAPILELIADLVSVLTSVLSPVIRIVGDLTEWIAKLTGGLVKALNPIEKVRDAMWRLGNQIRSTFSWTPPSWMQKFGVRGFHSGGTVPGAPGSGQLAMLQGGERVIPAGAGNPAAFGMGSDGGGGQPIVINVQVGVGDPNEIGRSIADYLGEYSRNAGGVDITLRQTG
jgi:hypothetical protein